ncbi:putative peptidase S49 [Helianthus annuus]|nr:putative peptidase S49 [Helianthus annuus]KAJ0920485.1 putative peptidase S49 [Helianthus annuus]
MYGLTSRAMFLGGVFEKIGVEPQVQRIGKYKSAGDQLFRKNISEENREVLTTLLDNIYGNWVDKVSQAKGEEIDSFTLQEIRKSKEEIDSFINEGVYQIDKLKEDGWITDIKYDDEVYNYMNKKHARLPILGVDHNSSSIFETIFCIYHLNVKPFQVRSMLKTRLDIVEKKKLPLIDYK